MILISIIVFIAAYLVNMFYITGLYHRGLTHGALELHPLTRAFVVRTGSWVTGIDPKAWACMHRMHHSYSDTAKDPHSPSNLGVFGVFFGQLRSYERALAGLAKGHPKYTGVVRDLEFPISWVNRKQVWMLPYILHLVIAVALGFATDTWYLGAAYWLGMMSHPVQGWMVNSFAHRFGYQNHENGDQSRNNALVALFTMGEGYQNNHHANPLSPKFSEKWYEFDAGYGLCWIARTMRIVKF
jgi:stearoyl-CoA desaturase (delta-9 desaturase)